MVELKLKQDNQKEDLKVIFPKFHDKLPIVDLFGNHIMVNDCMIAWRNAPLSPEEKEHGTMLWTPISLGIYVDGDCRAEIHFKDIRSLRFHAEGVFGKGFYNLSWE